MEEEQNSLDRNICEYGISQLLVKRYIVMGSIQFNFSRRRLFPRSFSWSEAGLFPLLFFPLTMFQCKTWKMSLVSKILGYVVVFEKEFQTQLSLDIQTPTTRRYFRYVLGGSKYLLSRRMSRVSCSRPVSIWMILLWSTSAIRWAVWRWRNWNVPNRHERRTCLVSNKSPVWALFRWSWKEDPTIYQNTLALLYLWHEQHSPYFCLYMCI